jgi:O-antigen biosynthesis protein WbqP
MKRILDITLALALAFPFALISIPIVIAVRLDSAGPALFKQRRLGRNGRTFTVLKWRTMATDTGDLPSHEASRSKITHIGSVLRRTKLDELPQVWNVLTGDMSFVGPRPSLPSQTELIAARERLGVHRLRPGITGISQLAGLDMSDPERLAQMDSVYLHRNGVLVDLEIIVKTALNRGGGDAVTL